MIKYDWVSRKRYRIDQRVGKLIYIDRLGKYLLMSGRVTFAVDQDFASKAHAVEERINAVMGRPSYFPGERTTGKYIMLPERLWEKLKKIDESYSVSIGRLADGQT